jgi:predicted transcriptional regulator
MSLNIPYCETMPTQAKQKNPQLSDVSDRVKTPRKPRNTKRVKKLDISADVDVDVDVDANTDKQLSESVEKMTIVKPNTPSIAQKYYLCVVCDKEYKSKGGLKRHMSNHTEVDTKSTD